MLAILLPASASAQTGFERLIPADQLEAIRERQEQRTQYLEEQQRSRDAREVKLKEVEAIRERTQSTREEKVATSTNVRDSRFTTFVEEKLREHLAITKTRILAAINRLEGFISRIEKLLDRREALGQDISKIETKLDEAKTSTRELRDGVDSLDNIVAEIIDNANPDENDRAGIIREIKSEIKIFTDQIKVVHAEIVEIIRMIKDLPEPDVDAAQESAQ